MAANQNPSGRPRRPFPTDEVIDFVFERGDRGAELREIAVVAKNAMSAAVPKKTTYSRLTELVRAGILDKTADGIYRRLHQVYCDADESVSDAGRIEWIASFGIHRLRHGTRFWWARRHAEAEMPFENFRAALDYLMVDSEVEV